MGGSFLMGRMQRETSSPRLFEDEEDDDLFMDSVPQVKEQPLNPAVRQEHPLTHKKFAGGEVRLNIDEYLSLLAKMKTLQSIKPPQNYIVSEICMKGETKGKIDQCAQFDLDIHLQQLHDEWTCINLLPTSIVVMESNVSSPASETESKEEFAFLGVSGGHHCLFVQKSGSYSVKLHVKVPFASSRAQGLEIRIPLAVKNSLDFLVHQNDVEITAVPSLGSSLSCSNTEEENLTKTPQGDAWTRLSCDVPPTSHLNIQWKEKVEDEAPTSIDEQEKQVIINVEQYTVHSIGEGVVQGTTELSYRILHGSRSSFEILVPTATRILSVEGDAIKRWDVLINERKKEQQEGDGEDEVWESAERENCKLLKVWLDYGIENDYQLILNTETDMESTSCDVVVPAISCHGVNREKGFLAIEARTNVEVSELEQQGLARIAFNELPQRLIDRSVNPPLLSYKFLLSTQTYLNLDVKKHNDAEVLIASIESAHVQGTLSEDKILYNLTMRVHNTQTQYVRVRLPENSTVWSSLVADRAVKPAKDSKGDVMIPLQKSRTSDNKHEAFSVELVYLTVLPQRLQRKGKVSLSICPLVDIPINHLFVTLKLPSTNDYGEFIGDVQEVNHFSSSPPTSESLGGYPPQNMMSNAIFEQMPQQQSFLPRKQRARKKGKGSLVSGILPVKIQMPQGGKSFYFERLLVMNESFTVSVTYKRLKQKTRRLGYSRRYAAFVCFAIFLVFALLWRLFGQ